MKITVKAMRIAQAKMLLMGGFVQSRIISKFIKDNIHRIPVEEHDNWKKEMWQNGYDNWYYKCVRVGDLVYFHQWAALLGLSRQSAGGRGYLPQGIAAS